MVVVIGKGKFLMNKAFRNKLLYWIREASDQGNSGFMYDYEKSEEEQSEDWIWFENEAIDDIERFMDNFGIN